MKAAAVLGFVSVLSFSFSFFFFCSVLSYLTPLKAQHLFHYFLSQQRPRVAGGGALLASRLAWRRKELMVITFSQETVYSVNNTKQKHHITASEIGNNWDTVLQLAEYAKLLVSWSFLHPT
jgi:hypothetical protein